VKYGECLKNLWKCVAAEESRYTLQAVKIDAEKKVAVVTDGHCLAVKDITALLEPDEKTFLLPVKALKAARALWLEERARFRTKNQKERDVRPIFIRATEDAVTVYIGASKRGQSFDMVTGQYPQWEVVATEVKDHHKSVTLSLGILSNLVEAMREYKGEDAVTFYTESPDKPVLVAVSGEGKSYGILMPMRVDHNKPTRFWIPKK
jgi:DNA polymerase III sliding clamp (beta) subunit (PCNA family)